MEHEVPRSSAATDQPMVACGARAASTHAQPCERQNQGAHGLPLWLAQDPKQQLGPGFPAGDKAVMCRQAVSALVGMGRRLRGRGAAGDRLLRSC